MHGTAWHGVGFGVVVATKHGEPLGGDWAEASIRRPMPVPLQRVRRLSSREPIVVSFEDGKRWSQRPCSLNETMMVMMPRFASATTEDAIQPAASNRNKLL